MKRILRQNSLAQHWAQDWARDWRALALTQVHHMKRKKTYKPKEGWEDGTAATTQGGISLTGRKVCC